jgi:hypothetical protein
MVRSLCAITRITAIENRGLLATSDKKRSMSIVNGGANAGHCGGVRVGQLRQ